MRLRHAGCIRATFGLPSILCVLGGLLGPSTVAGQRPAVRPPVQIDSLTDEQLRAYVATLRFVADPEAGDRQALLVGHYPDAARYGPLATIAPEEHSYLGSIAQLAFGKFIARITNESAESYPKLGLRPHAVTYWWVQYGARGSRARSVFVTIDSLGRVTRTERGLQITGVHRLFRVNQPLARFVWTDDDEEVWGTCNGACCKQVLK